MGEAMEKTTSFDELRAAAERDDWDFVDAHINASHLTDERVHWAVWEGLREESDNVRDLAATLLDRSDAPIDEAGAQRLLSVMEKDTSHVVRYRVAIALYKRGNRQAEVVSVLEEAKSDPDVGELVKDLLPRQ